MNHPALKQVSRVLIMPRDGVVSVRRLIDQARHSLLLKIFSFDSPELVAAVLDASARGVAVRLLLNPVRSTGTRPNDETYDTMRDHRVDVRWTNSHFAVTHEKSMVIDGRIALIATFNFVDKYFTGTRDYGLLIEKPSIIDEIVACFDADWSEGTFAARDDSPLAWSNLNARQVVAAFIDGAHQRLFLQHPKFDDPVILERVLSARKRKVHVRLLCGGHHGISDRDIIATFSSLRILADAGVHVRRQRHLRLHAKMLISDDAQAMVGSMNIDSHAYDVRRELGVVLDDEVAVRQLLEQFKADWTKARHYDAPDPLTFDLAAAIEAELDDALARNASLVHE